MSVAAVSYRSTMNASDAIIWHIEQDPLLQSTIMTVWELEAEPTPERMRESAIRMMTSIKRLHQRVEAGRPRPRWVDVPDISIDDHFSTHQLGGVATMADARAFAETWVREPFERTKPLWRLGLLTGLEDGRAAVVIKVHHAIADGIGLVLMLAAFTDLEPNPTERFVAGRDRDHRDRNHPDRDHPDRDDVARTPWSRLRRWTYRGRAAWQVTRDGPATATRRGLATLASMTKVVWPHRTPHSRLMTGRSTRLHLDARSIPLRALKEAGRAAGVSLNDAFVALIADAVGRYHDRHGVACDTLRIHMPVNVRTTRTATLAGNQFVPARISLAVPARHEAHGLGRVSAQIEQLRAEPGLPHINAVSAAVQRTGVMMTRLIIGGMMKGVDVLASNVPGPNFALYLAGVRVEEFVAYGPPAGAALNVTLFSYRSTIHLGITTDAAAITDREGFLECLDASIAHLVGEHRSLPAGV
jgi:diacylglycerol O-acyltransferase / wax synthase